MKDWGHAQTLRFCRICHLVRSQNSDRPNVRCAQKVTVLREKIAKKILPSRPDKDLTALMNWLKRYRFHLLRNANFQALLLNGDDHQEVIELKRTTTTLLASSLSQFWISNIRKAESDRASGMIRATVNKPDLGSNF